MSQWIEWIKQNRQASLLAALVLVALVMWGRMLVADGAGPSAVEATGAAAVAIEQDPADRVASVQELLPQALPTQPVAMPERPRRDLFTTDGWGRMGQVENQGEIDAVEEKSDPQASDENRRLALESAARSRLKLQSVVSGDAPQAVINGRVLSPGERIEGFELVAVGRRSVLVSYEGFVIRLSM